jgi:molybdopterin converting factor small subunit
MRITVHYMTQIKRAAGCSSELFDARDGADLREALQSLADRHGETFRAMLLDESSEPRCTLLFFVGDERADFARRLREGDTITILAPMAGG